MSIVKSFTVGNGDMFYIKHNTDNFTIIDCCMTELAKSRIVSELKTVSRGRNLFRFISTHPDDDHIKGLVYLNQNMPISNFYCVKNQTIKNVDTDDFKVYCTLRDDPKKAFYLHKGCSRKWLNQGDEIRCGAGIHVLWPVCDNRYYIEALMKANIGEDPNNISPIVKYSLNGGAKFLWMGDIETDFMNNIENDIVMNATDILFAPHHGRDTGKVPGGWLRSMMPRIVIIGDAPSKYLNYYEGYNTITQNSAGDITFECISKKIHIYVSNENYSVDFLDNENLSDTYGKYLGTLKV